MDFLSYVVGKALVLIPPLYFLGSIFRSLPGIKNWLIPFILLPFGVAGSIALLGLTVDAVIQGVLVTAATVYTNNLVKQGTKKKGW